MKQLRDQTTVCQYMVNNKLRNAAPELAAAIERYITNLDNGEIVPSYFFDALVKALGEREAQWIVEGSRRRDTSDL